MVKKKARTISIKDLTTLVNKAVADELEISVPSSRKIHRGIIYGFVSSDLSADQAGAIAAKITRKVAASFKSAGISTITPAVTTTNRGRTIGFVAT